MTDGAPAGPIEELLHEIWQEVAALDSGEVATYIPELAKADPATCGIGLATLDGRVYTAGDLVPFTIQSVSKPYVYALALADRGQDAVLAKVGAEPTGDPFNSISLDEHTGRAFNPMVNAGAIATCSRLPGDGVEEQWTRLRAGLSAFAGRELALDGALYDSVSATNFRNREITAALARQGALAGDPDDALELYTRQSSLLVCARDLAVMGATLADGGVNPVTRERVVDAGLCQPVLAVMATSGMYERSGDWLYDVGLPGKSGIGGGVLTVSPGKAGLGTFSPPLDGAGNSVRGVLAATLLARALGLGLFTSRPA